MGDVTMAAENAQHRLTESKYKGGAREMYVTYDLEQRTRGGSTASYPKVKRVYIAGPVKSATVGKFRKRTGREVYGVRIEYEQSRRGYGRKAFTGRRGSTSYDVGPANVARTRQTFTQIVEVPERAKHVRFHEGGLPPSYQSALQAVH